MQLYDSGISGTSILFSQITPPYLSLSFFLPVLNIPLFLFGPKRQGAALKTVDFVVEGIDRSKVAMIITGRQEQVCSLLSETFGCGATVFPATGYYSGDAKCCVYIILNRFQIGRTKELVHECGPQAYITITKVVDVFTNGGAAKSTRPKRLYGKCEHGSVGVLGSLLDPQLVYGAAVLLGPVAQYMLEHIGH